MPTTNLCLWLFMKYSFPFYFISLEQQSHRQLLHSQNLLPWHTSISPITISKYAMLYLWHSRPCLCQFLWQQIHWLCTRDLHEGPTVLSTPTFISSWHGYTAVRALTQAAKPLFELLYHFHLPSSAHFPSQTEDAEAKNCSCWRGKGQAGGSSWVIIHWWAAGQEDKRDN